MERPAILLLALPIAAFLVWIARSSRHPLPPRRARLLLGVRLLSCALVLAALASPLLKWAGSAQTVFFVLDRSASLGPSGRDAALESCRQLIDRLPPRTSTGILTAAASPEIVHLPGAPGSLSLPVLVPEDQQQTTHLEAALRLAVSLFPAGASSHAVLLTDGLETAGDLLAAARLAASKGVRVHTLPIAGEAMPDARITRLTTSQPRIHEGATLGLNTTVESSVDGTARLRLFENGIEIERRDLTLAAGIPVDLEFRRTPPARNLFTYRAALEAFSSTDTLPANNEALAVVEVLGPPLVLYVEGEEGQAHYLADAMAAEDIVFQVRPPSGVPSRPGLLAAYDAVILSDVEARLLSEPALAALRSYVEELGGGFLMLGGSRSFGPGGYHRTPVEEMLPVGLRDKDREEDPVSALALVLDRSGSMTGEKLAICKSAALATAELLQEDDFIGIYAFDSTAHPVLPLARVGSRGRIDPELNLISAGGGTNIQAGLSAARDALCDVPAKTKHMIVLTDGRTLGQGYEALAASCLAEGITISTVAVGAEADVSLLQRIAASGGGKSYVTLDPSAITRIFTQDAMRHTTRLIREEPFQAAPAEPHPMIAEWPAASAPPLLGFVKTERKPSAQVILTAGNGLEAPPLLAHWRFGHGRVTAFTSDCKARWATLWLNGWDGYSKLWSQVLRETMRRSSGRNLDLRLETREDRLHIQADLLADAGTRVNGASVTADVFHILDHAPSSSLRPAVQLRLRQTGPGFYEASFSPEEAGIYLVRAEAGSQTVTASHVHRPPAETASGRVNIELLRQVAELTGGQLLSAATFPKALEGSSIDRRVPLWPVFVALLIPSLLADLVLRRWEAVRAIARLHRSDQWTSYRPNL